MNRKGHFISLSVKMAIAVMVGLGLSLAMFACCMWVEDLVVIHKYQSEQAVSYNVGDAYESLEQYIGESRIDGTDSKALSAWLKSEDYTYLCVFDDSNVAFEGGWWVGSDEEGPEPMKQGVFEADVRHRIVQFADGEYYVYIDVYKEEGWKQLMDIITLALCFLTLLTTILVYNGKLLTRVGILSANIQKVSDGDLDHQVFPLRNDELGALAVSVDNMRTSIIRKHQNEKDAWQANQQLITEMSHDIRTPLTSLIGYLDIIAGEKYDSPEELTRYIAASREKAFQLKDLSDKLFQYFLVYGSQAEKELEKFDASILFQQVLMEHSAELTGYGYKVDFNYDVPEVDVMVDISGLRRLFDNIFSNIMKYADYLGHISIDAKMEEDKIKVTVANDISALAKKVESTKIGLKTCEKICSLFGGTFVYEEREQRFFAKVELPAVADSRELLTMNENDVEKKKEQGE